MKKIIKVLLTIIILFAGFSAFAADVNLTIRDGNTIIFPTSPIPIQPGDSVLTVLNNADQSDSSWNVSDLQHYSFGDYIKCITSIAGNHCDNWQYAVNNSYPSSSIDQNILSGGENVYIYFGPQNKIILNSNNINTNDTLTITSQKYDYNNNQWIIRTGTTVGLTQPNPDDPWSPIEIMTDAVDENGQAIFSTIPAGFYNTGIKEDGYFPTETLTVTTPPIQRGGGIIFSPPAPAIKAKFDLQKAFEFIISQQKENGSFDEDLYTDWIALALAGTADFQNQKEKLIKYFGKFKANDYQLTDYERHAMALMALGLNPYDINGENYIKKITDSFDGKQFGDITKDNDDIFALIVLQNAGFTQTEKMISDDIAFVLSNQKRNGSWDESVDMTGAGIESLSFFSQDKPTSTLSGQVKNALSKAKDFLKQNQKNEGGFGNVSSTAWTIEGILALSEKPEDWIKNDNTPLDYLAENQDLDGGMKNDNMTNKLWETSYVVSAFSGKTWSQIMQKFEKPGIPVAPDIKPPVQKTEVPKKIVKKIVRIIKTQNPVIQNTATVINSLETKNPEPIKKNWFRNFLDKIFSIF